MELALEERIFTRLRGHFREIVGAKSVVNDGLRLLIDRDVLQDPILVRSLLFDRHERGESALIKASLRPGDRVVEIGAGVGFVTMTCARIAGPENVTSFEGNPAMHNLLLRNLQANRLPVKVHQQVVSKDGKAAVFGDASAKVSSSLKDREGTSGRRVETASFPELVAKYRPSYIVMDIEGSEVDLLGTCPLDGVNKVAVEVHLEIVGEPAVLEMEQRLETLGLVRDKLYIDDRRRLYSRVQ